jgi:hypothetical protein
MFGRTYLKNVRCASKIPKQTEPIVSKNNPTFQISMEIPQLLRLTQSDSVNDRSMIQFIRKHRILRCKDSFEQTRIGVKAGRIQNGILSLMELGQFVLQVFVDGLCAANEPHRAQTCSIVIQCFFASGYDTFVGLKYVRKKSFSKEIKSFWKKPLYRQSQVVVGAKIQNFPMGSFHIYRRGLR